MMLLSDSDFAIFNMHGRVHRIEDAAALHFRCINCDDHVHLSTKDRPLSGSSIEDLSIEPSSLPIVCRCGQHMAVSDGMLKQFEKKADYDRATC